MKAILIITAVSSILGVVSGYEPTSYVEAAHNIPHLSSSLTASNNDFTYINEDMQGYLMSLAVLPAIILAAGLVSLIVYQLVLCCRCCCTRCCHCCKADEPYVPKDPNEKKDWLFSRSFKEYPWLMAGFVISLVLLIAANNFFFFGNEKLNQGVDDGKTSFGLLSDYFSDISDTGATMAQDGSDMTAILDSSDCSSIPSANTTDMRDFIDGYVSASDSVSSLVGTLPDTISDAEDKMDYYLREKKNQVLYAYYGFIMGISLLLFLADCCRSKIYLGFSIVVSEVIVTALTLLACAEMILVTLLGDFCMDPSGNIISIAPNGAKDIMRYYLECDGTNPFFEDVNSTQKYAVLINETIQSMSSSITAQCVNKLSNQLVVMVNDIVTLLSYLDCPRLYAVFDAAINQAICTSTFDGIFVIWLTHFITAGALFFVLIALSYFYAMYTKTTYPVGGAYADQAGDIEMHVQNGGSGYPAAQSQFPAHPAEADAAYEFIVGEEPEAVPVMQDEHYQGSDKKQRRPDQVGVEGHYTK